MSFKEELMEWKKRLLSQKNNNAKKNTISEVTSEAVESRDEISLSKKIDDYIAWNYENMIKGHYTNYGEYGVPLELRNLIEKVAVWYELRYPYYEVNKKLYCCGADDKSISDIMFNQNKYVNDLVDENSDVRALDWDEFYNASVFFNSLPWEERYRFLGEKYPEIVYVDSLKSPHLHLNSEGIVEQAEYFEVLSGGKIKNRKLKGMHVKDVITLLKENQIELPENNELESSVKRVELATQEREGLLDSIMYRIIERGGNRIGPRRAFLFAKEFGRNIDIPMMYSIDYSDPGLRLFINEYIKNGGSKDLMCYVDYFSSILVDNEVKKISIQDLILTLHNNAATFYTPEETELHQRIANAISSQINPEELRKEQVKQLRLQRKIEKSKHNK